MENSIIIRPFAPTDAEPFATAVRESFQSLRPWMPWSREDYSAADATEWFNSCHQSATDKTAFEFAIVSSQNEFLGGTGINRIDYEFKRANLGYWVRTGGSRRGVATRACRLIAAWAFDNTDLVRLEIFVAVANIPSRGVAAKAGAIYEGVARSRLPVHGVFQDASVFSIIRNDKRN